jgi:phenylpyruvate tautomerase PptA (4-oxalocrotonate tautomerase family)
MASLKDLFADFGEVFAQPEHTNNGKEPLIATYTTVISADREAVSVIGPNINTGPWIAGGAPLRWFQGLSVGENDIDVFCANARQAQDVISRIKSYSRYTIKHESENAVTIEYWKKDDYGTRWTIQVITRRYFASIKEVIDNFDISVCEIGTCGNEWVLGQYTARDIREKNLRFNQPLAADAAKRLVKYWIYGYRPVSGTIEAIQNNPESRWQFQHDEDYNNAF